MSSQAIRPQSLDRSVAAAIAFSLGIRGLFALLGADLVPRNDAHVYVSLGRTLAESGTYPELFRPPLYPAFLAGVFTSGGGLLAARLAQVLLATASVWLLARIAGRALGRRTGAAAAWILAIDPVLLGFSHLLWSETLYVFLLLTALDLWLADARPGGRFAAAGALLGLGALARPQLLTFVPLLAAWLVWRAPAAGRARTAAWTLLLLGAMVAVVAPWTLRNVARTGAVVVVDTNGPFNLLVGTEPSAAFVDKDDHWSLYWGLLDGEAYAQVSRRDPARAMRAGSTAALENIRADPSTWITHSLWEARHLWTLDSFPLRHLRNGWYGDAPRASIALATIACAGFSLALYAAGLLGLLALPRSSLRDTAVLTLLHATLLFGATYALSRYAVPMRPFLAVGAGWAITHRNEWRAQLATSRPRLVLALGLLALLASGLWSDLPLLWDMLTTGGTAHRFSWLPQG